MGNSSSSDSFSQCLVDKRLSSPYNFPQNPEAEKGQIQILLQTIRKNIQNDYESSFTQANITNILNLFRKILSQAYSSNQLSEYNRLKKELDSNEKQILQWIQLERLNKYSLSSFLKELIKPKEKVYHDIQSCLSPDSLSKSRDIKFYPKDILEKASLAQVTIQQTKFKIGKCQVDIKGNKFMVNSLIQQKEGEQQSETIWQVQKTKDKRHIWRSRYQVDRIDIKKLLLFLLWDRCYSNNSDVCPSILINAGSHGVKDGNSFTKKNRQLSDDRIIKQAKDAIAELIQLTKEYKLKLNQQNVQQKICVSVVSSCNGCIYPQSADHIIDLQCYGAYSAISANQLVQEGFIHDEVDLIFLKPLGKNSEVAYKSQIRELKKIKDQNQRNPLNQQNSSEPQSYTNFPNQTATEIQAHPANPHPNFDPPNQPLNFNNEFSNIFKSTYISLTHGNTIAAHPFKTNSPQIVFIEDKTPGQIHSLKFRIKCKSKRISLGLGLRYVVAASFYQVKDYGQGLGHGCFLISSEGWQYSHSVRTQNKNQTNFKYNEGDIVRMELVGNELLYFNETKNLNGKMEILLRSDNELKQLCFCVQLSGNGDSVELL